MNNPKLDVVFSIQFILRFW